MRAHGTTWFLKLIEACQRACRQRLLFIGNTPKNLAAMQKVAKLR